MTTRRTFLKSVGAAAASGVLLPPWLFADSGHFHFVASQEGSIQSFLVGADGVWTLVQTTLSPSPACLALSAERRVLYVANAIERFEHRPAGSVEAYSVEAGRLRLINRQSLALFATRPERMEPSPDALTVWLDGGARNVLPLERDGSVGRLTDVFRAVGRGSLPLINT